MMQKKWTHIAGGKGKYMVSNYGEVRSCFKGDDWYPIKPFSDTCGYQYVEVMKKRWPVHKLVAMNFVPRADGQNEINHKDGDKSNNRADNLEWCTRSENMKHAYDTGLKKGLSGEDHKRSTPVLCVDTDTIYACQREAAEATGVPQANISKCCLGKRRTAGGYRWAFVKGGDADVVGV